MKIPKQINVKTALIFVVIGILLTSLVLYVFAATPSSTYYISPGVYPGAPSYTVWREGSNYFAKDTNGQLRYSGTNATEIIQNCVADNISLLIKGSITLDGQIYLANNMVVDLTNAKIKQGRAGGTDYNAFLVAEGKHNIRIFGGDYDGNRDGGTSHQGISIAGNSYNVTVEHVTIHNVWGTGILILNSSRCKILNNYVYDVGNPSGQGPGIRLDLDADRNLVSGNHINNGHEHGIKEYAGCEHNIITANLIEDVVGNGIAAAGVHTTVSNNIIQNVSVGQTIPSIYANNKQKIIGNTVIDSPYYAIVIGNNTLVANNYIYNASYGIQANENCSVTSNNIWNIQNNAIHAVGDDTVITGNVCRDSSRGIKIQDADYLVVTANILVDNSYGIEEVDTSDYNIITSCNTRDCTNGIIIVGSNTKVHLCWNKTSWIA